MRAMVSKAFFTETSSVVDHERNASGGKSVACAVGLPV
jgi:hypothetical protein